MHYPPADNTFPRQPDVAERIAAVIGRLRPIDNLLGFGIWEIGTTDRIGEVMNGIQGVGRQPCHIMDGHQYVGGFPAYMWRIATTDELYRTLSYGIKTFSRRWNQIKKEVRSSLHYVSIGPGTGEKDRMILKHLQTLPGLTTLVYVPVDISHELLRMSLGVTLPEMDLDRLAVIPIQLDIANDESLQELKALLADLTAGDGMLLSLLGNTLANFENDRHMLTRISSLLSDDDLLLIELATTTAADEMVATLAAAEYEGSKSFRQFAMAALCDYTNCRLETGRIVYDGQAISDDLLQVTTSFAPLKALKVEFRDGNEFTLKAQQTIELYKSRKYTQKALEELLSDFTELKVASSLYSTGSAFGVVTKLLRQRNVIAPEVVMPENMELISMVG
jgi:uncharacterized SAM-dependent methyltransferase